MLVQVVLAALCFTAIHAEIRSLSNPDRIPGHYLAVLHSFPGTRAVKNQHIDTTVTKIEATSNVKVASKIIIGEFMALALRSHNEAEVDGLNNLPEIHFIEVDAMAYAQQCTSQATGSRLWGLSRINSEDLPDFSSATFTAPAADSSVAVYVMDTGIRTSHQDFGGRADEAWFYPPYGGGDLHGHGTHCAGTVGGTEYGVAKTVPLRTVKCLSNSGGGSWEAFMQGLEFIESQAGVRVASASLGGGSNTAVNAAVDAATAAGVYVVVAAGNNNNDASLFSPAGAQTAIAVGATTITDARSGFSNFGSLVDLQAPGSDILSAWIGSDTDSRVLSGTSMACPHVAGLVARYLETAPGTPTRDEVVQYLQDQSSKDKLSGLPDGTVNMLAFVEPC